MTTSVIHSTAEAHLGIDKIKRYGWTAKDEPGRMEWLDKAKLQVHPAYQRESSLAKVREIASNWSHVACGVIVVGLRGDDYWVIDGQHRVLAAKRRSDIKEMPCIVFQTADVRQEAVAFLDLNAGRKPVSAIAKFRAQLAAGDPIAGIVHDKLQEKGVSLKQYSKNAQEFKSVALALRLASHDRDVFRLVFDVAYELCKEENISVSERLLDGLWYLHGNIPGGLSDPKFLARIRSVGVLALMDSALRASAYFAKGGAKVWATGMLESINKGLRNRFEFKAGDTA